MISHKYKCIFFHIPKTAGTSIEKKLEHFKTFKRGIQDHRTVKDIEPLSSHDLLKIIKLCDLSFVAKRLRNRLMKKGGVSKQHYDTYFKFTFVRNPWARVFSWYMNVMRDEKHQKDLGISRNCSFKQFLNDHLDQWALRPQLFWITNINGEIPLDFIGRFEKLQEDFVHVCDVLNIKDNSLPKLIPTTNPLYVDMYDEDMKNIVAQRYADEIRFFKFEFGQ